MSKRRLVVVGWIGLLAACGEGPGAPDETTEEASEPILGGVLDSTHPAAVAYLMGGKCTATIVDVNGSQGWALTAAHCINPNNMGVLRQGQNHASGYVQYTVDAVVVHPDYGKAPFFDFAMLHFTGATGGTPVIPAMSSAEDNLAAGQIVSLVGYGQTEVGGTTLRLTVDKPVDSLSELTIAYDQTAGGGHCFGDSGGPSVRQVGGQDRVAGVASSVSDAVPECTGFGFSARVSAVHSTFIAPTINGMAASPQTCSQCLEGTTSHVSAICFDDAIDCFSEDACLDYEDCLLDCNDPIGCGCGAVHPQGEALYEGLVSCICDTGCSVECANNGLCPDPPECGIGTRSYSCGSCLESNCCAEGTACGNDAECSSCFPNCPGTNAPSNALLACLATSCSGTCGVDPGNTGTGTGTDTTTGTGTGTGSDTWTGTGTDTGTGTGGTKNTSGSDPDEDDGCHVSRVGGGTDASIAWTLAALLGLVWSKRRRARGASA